ncbi:type I polyketide synthase [Sphaerisporangium dianthi]|uniref:Type I polyketide synthase n=1 Tax=Sphaerisporangium dianthi TaxID=1436120 RepID=A0ABV9CR34_9ACTN
MTDQRKLLEQALHQLRDTRTRLAAAERARREPVAVLGAGVRLPGGVLDLPSYWDLLRDGVDAVTPMVSNADGHRPPAGERPESGHWAGLLDEVDRFDAGFFGISAGEADRMDPQQRLVLEAAWEAIEDAGLPIDHLQGSSTGVFLGVYGSDYLSMQFAEPGTINTYTAPGGAHSILANRLSYLLDLQGPSLAVDTACSSSLMAVHLAVRALRQGDCDIALAGGVNLLLSPLSTLVTEKVLPMAPGGRCRTFDASADGIIRAEGCGVLVLVRESSAGGRRVRGVIRGTAANHDGRTNGLTAPNPRAQAGLLRRALADASAEPGEVGYIEAHGTGTPLGDPIEMEALREVYGPGDMPCAVGSVKTNFGHQEAAAGITGLIKAMLVLEHGQVPPNLHLRRMNPEIDLEGSRLRVPTKLVPLPKRDGAPLAAVSSFGFGGANVHAILQAAPPPQDAGPRPDKLVLPLSGRGTGALTALARAYADRLAGAGRAEAAEVCAAAATRRSGLSHRTCLIADDPADLVGRLRELGGHDSLPDRPVPVRRPRVAFVFSGQGSQWAAMGAEVLDREPVVRAEVEACDAIVRELAGWSIIERLTGRDDDLRETEAAQICIAALQLGLAALWRSWGIAPYAVTGHSMGEITAARAAGMLSRDQAFELLLHRARLTEEGARKGAMTSIGLPVSEVGPLLAAEPMAGIGAVNGPRSTVVSGERRAVERVGAAAERLGARTRRLHVGYGFHSPLLDGHADKLASKVAHIAADKGDVPFISTVTGTRVTAERLDGEHWGRNLRDAVLFSPAVEAVAEMGVTVFLEIGPHPVLLRDISETLEESEIRHLAVGSLRRDQPLTATLDRSLAELYRAGLDVDWEAVLGAPSRDVAIPTYPWQRERHWLPAGTVDTAGLTWREPALAATTTAAGPPAVANAAPATAEPLEERIDAIALYVRRRIAAALNAEDVDEVPADRPLEEFALDSLVIVELKNQVENELGVAVPLQALLGVMHGGTALDLATAIATREGRRAEQAALQAAERAADQAAQQAAQQAADARAQNPDQAADARAQTAVAGVG